MNLLFLLLCAGCLRLAAKLADPVKKARIQNGDNRRLPADRTAEHFHAKRYGTNRDFIFLTVKLYFFNTNNYKQVDSDLSSVKYSYSIDPLIYTYDATGK